VSEVSVIEIITQ